MRIHVGVLVVVAALVASAGCNRTATTNGKARACGTFTGGRLTASWTECPDKVRREVTCAPFVDTLKCDCFEDGARKWFFNAKDPPLATREDATRVANANCHWSLE